MEQIAMYWLDKNSTILFSYNIWSLSWIHFHCTTDRLLVGLVTERWIRFCISHLLPMFFSLFPLLSFKLLVCLYLWHHTYSSALLFLLPLFSLFSFPHSYSILGAILRVPHKIGRLRTIELHHQPCGSFILSIQIFAIYRLSWNSRYNSGCDLTGHSPASA